MPEATDLGADVVAHKAFRTSFRGYDQHEVRAYLAQVAVALASAEGRARLLAEQLAAAEAAAAHADVGEAELEAALGAHAAAVLQAARTAAADLRAAAERDADERRIAAETEAEATLGHAAERARQIVAEAHAEREAVVRDLARRQRAAHQQLAQLRADRVGLLEALGTARSVADGAMERLAAAAADDLPSLRRRRPREAVPGAPDETATTPTSREAEPAGPGADVVDAAAATDGGSSGLGAGADVVPASTAAGGATDHGDPVAGAEPPGGVTGARAPVGVPVGLPQDPSAPTDGDGVVTPAAAAPAGPGVDDLLARLREDRATALAQAAALLTDIDVVPSEPPPASGRPRTSSPPVGPVPRASRSGAAPPPSEASVGAAAPDVGVAAFERRDGEVDVHEQALTRALRRALVDEQNWLLDALRRARGVPDVGGLLAPAAERSGHLADISEPFLVAAAAAAALAPPWRDDVPSCPGGVGSVEPPPSSTVEVREVAGALGTELVAGLRTRLETVTARGRAAGDPAAVGEAVSAAYRECRAERVQPLARDAVQAAWGAGAFAAAPDAHLSWVLDPADRCSDDCADNAQAGPRRKGEPFPTGDRHPPAHPGCRCLLVPASR